MCKMGTTLELASDMEQKTAVEKLNIVKYGAKRVFEPPNENSNEGHFGAHIGPMRSFHRDHDLLSTDLCVVPNPPVFRHPQFRSE